MDVLQLKTLGTLLPEQPAKLLEETERALMGLQEEGTERRARLSDILAAEAISVTVMQQMGLMLKLEQLFDGANALPLDLMQTVGLSGIRNFEDICIRRIDESIRFRYSLSGSPLRDSCVRYIAREIVDRSDICVRAGRIATERVQEFRSEPHDHGECRAFTERMFAEPSQSLLMIMTGLHVMRVENYLLGTAAIAKYGTELFDLLNAAAKMLEKAVKHKKIQKEMAEAAHGMLQRPNLAPQELHVLPVMLSLVKPEHLFVGAIENLLGLQRKEQ